MSTREKLNKRIARLVREEIAEALHAASERVTADRKSCGARNQQTGNAVSVSGE